MGNNYMTGYYWYYASREEALNWPIAPGNFLVFMDPDGKHFYTKMLGRNPYDRIIFKAFSEDEEQPMTPQAPVSQPYSAPASDDTGIRAEIQEMKAQMATMMELLKSKPQWQNKKGDNK